MESCIARFVSEPIPMEGFRSLLVRAVLPEQNPNPVGFSLGVSESEDKKCWAMREAELALQPGCETFIRIREPREFCRVEGSGPKGTSRTAAGGRAGGLIG